MADLRISQMPAAASLEAADILPVVQGGINKHATLEVLEASLAFNNPTYELVTEPASLAPSGFTVLQSGPSDTLTVIQPVATQFATKVLIADAALSPIVISVPAGRGFNQLTMSLVGSSAELVYINGNWVIKCLHLTTAQLI